MNWHLHFKDVLIDVLLVLFVIDCLLMGLAIMMQRSKQEGLGTAFGGNVTSELFGAGASAFLVKATVWLAAIFFLLSITLAHLYSQRDAAVEKASAPVYEQLLPATPATTNAAPATMSAVPATTPASATATTTAPTTPAASATTSKVAPTTPAASTTPAAASKDAPAKPSGK